MCSLLGVSVDSLRLFEGDADYVAFLVAVVDRVMKDREAASGS